MKASNLLSPERKFCKEMLTKTSRTFALSVPLLKNELYWTVLVSYLLCRILDTIEDATSLIASRKKELLSSFSKLLKNNSHDSVKKWLIQLKKTPLDGESDHIKLVENSDQVLKAYFSLREDLRLATFAPIETMSYGMSEFAYSFERNPVDPLQKEEDLLSYCYYVAGTVGELLTESFCVFHSALKHKRKKLLPLARSFGETLQLVNIMKDVSVDAKRNISFLPREFLDLEKDEKEVIRKKILPLALKSSRKSIKFINELPLSLFRTRLFCLWPLWLSLATMKKLSSDLKSGDYISGKSIKISRITLYKTLFFVTLISCIPFLLRFDFERRYREIENLRSRTEGRKKLLL